MLGAWALILLGGAKLAPAGGCQAWKDWKCLYPISCDDQFSADPPDCRKKALICPVYSEYTDLMQDEQDSLKFCMMRVQVVRWLSLCSDGVIEGVEECDDGNAINGDGCSDSCLVSLTLHSARLVTAPHRSLDAPQIMHWSCCSSTAWKGSVLPANAHLEHQAGSCHVAKDACPQSVPGVIVCMHCVTWNAYMQVEDGWECSSTSPSFCTVSAGATHLRPPPPGRYAHPSLQLMLCIVRLGCSGQEWSPGTRQVACAGCCSSSMLVAEHFPVRAPACRAVLLHRGLHGQKQSGHLEVRACFLLQRHAIAATRRSG